LFAMPAGELPPRGAPHADRYVAQRQAGKAAVNETVHAVRPDGPDGDPGKGEAGVEYDAAKAHRLWENIWAMQPPWERLSSRACERRTPRSTGTTSPDLSPCSTRRSNGSSRQTLWRTGSIAGSMP